MGFIRLCSVYIHFANPVRCYRGLNKKTLKNKLSTKGLLSYQTYLGPANGIVAMVIEQLREFEPVVGVDLAEISLVA